MNDPIVSEQADCQSVIRSAEGTKVGSDKVIRRGGHGPTLRRSAGDSTGQGMWASGQVSPVELSTSAARSTRRVNGSTSAIALATVASWAPGAPVATDTCGTHPPGRKLRRRGAPVSQTAGA